MKRRELFKNMGIMLGTATALKAQALTQCGITPKQIKGPFYPVTEMAEVDADLSQTKNGEAIGQKIVVRGIVTDKNCKPIPGAIVEVWQACHTGRYDHPDDTSAGDLDPNFQYFARLKTNELGEYSFKSIIPGSYPASDTWFRPPHIHFRVVAPGHKEFITQMYFKGHNLNALDELLLQLPLSERRKLIVDFRPLIGDDVSLVSGTFNITLPA
jgi:protocatechuate 3,4-dioxygenase, beta subunit